MQLDCSGKKSWQHGSSLVNYMKLAEFEGLSGKVVFDPQGKRSQFQLEVMELRSTGLESIGKSINFLTKKERLLPFFDTQEPGTRLIAST